MILSNIMANRIVATAVGYVGTPYNWEEFNCVHFVRTVFANVGIALPKLIRRLPPPEDFHLSPEGFELMPLGHSVFFKKKTSQLPRSWTHIAFIVSRDQLVHCSRQFGKVVITPKDKFLNTYELSPKISAPQ